MGGAFFKTEIMEISNIKGTITATSSITTKTTTDTTIWGGGWVTDNFETYYLDKNMVKIK